MKLRAGVYGCGRDGQWSSRQLLLQDDCLLAAVADPDATAREAFARATGVGIVTDSFTALLETGVDLVILADADADRVRCVEQAAGQGAHCLLHTPMAATADEAAAMHAACEAAGVQLGVLVRPMGDPVFEQLRQMIAADWLGGIAHVQCLAGDDDVLRRPIADGDPRLRARGAGDPLLALGSHHVHLAAWLTGRPAVSVSAQQSSGFLPLPADGVVATALLRGNVTCTFAASHLLEAEQFAIHGTDGFVRLAGDRIVLRGRTEFRGHVFDYTEPGRELALLRRDVAAAAAREAPAAELHGRFARATDDRDDYPCSGEQAALDLRLLDAARRAAATGRAEPVA